MGDYGLKVYDASGNVTLDVSDRITRFRYSTTAAAGSSGSVNLSDTSGMSSVQVSVLIGTPTTSPMKAAHSVSHSGTTLSWTPAPTIEGYLFTHSTSGASLIFQFLYT